MESLFLEIHNLLDTRFQVDNPYAGDPYFSNCREYVALYYMEDNQSFKMAVEQKKRLFGQGKVTLKGLHTAIAKNRSYKWHAEKMLFQEFRKTNKNNEFDPSRMPDTKAMILYSTLSPCKKCMEKIKEFAENCEIGTTITIVYKEVYKGKLFEIEKPRINTIRMFSLEEISWVLPLVESFLHCTIYHLPSLLFVILFYYLFIYLSHST